MLIAGDIKRYIQGQVTLSGTAAVTLVVGNLDADSLVIPSINTPAGTVGNIKVTGKNTTTNTLTFISDASDTSVYDVLVFA